MRAFLFAVTTLFAASALAADIGLVKVSSGTVFIVMS